MSDETLYTVPELSQFIEKPQSTIRRWIKEGKLEATKTSKGYSILLNDKNVDFILTESRKRWNQPPLAYNPKELSEYSEWHQVLDEMAWLFKVCYSPDWCVKDKHFRMDIIFVRYLQSHKVTLKRVASVFAANQTHSLKAISDDLKRGWYNELAYSVPLKKSTLSLSFRDINLNSDISSVRFAFPSWKVITAYYSVYFYLRAITLQKFKNFRLQEHGATILSFKNTLLRPLSRVLWKFPLDIAYTPGERVYRNKLHLNNVKHAKFKFSRHPRQPHPDPYSIFERIYKTFTKKAKKSSRPTTYTLFDFLHDFRVWANYQNIDDLLSLWGTGYKAFIDQNLALLLFFIGGISEICFISVFGADKYLQSLQKLYDLFALNNPQLETEFVNTPLYQRCELYKEFGFIDRNIKLRREFNINEVVFLEPAKK